MESTQQIEEIAPPGFLDFVTDRYVQPKSNIKDNHRKTDHFLKDSSKIIIEKEKYRNKVKEYTQIAIGRKIPESYRKYTAKDI